MRVFAMLGMLLPGLLTSCIVRDEQTGEQRITIEGNKNLYSLHKDYPGPFTNSLATLVERDAPQEYFEQQAHRMEAIKWTYTYVDPDLGAMSAHLYVGYYDGGAGISHPERRKIPGSFRSAIKSLNSKNITITAQNGTLTLHFTPGNNPDYDKIEIEVVKGYFTFAGVIVGLSKENSEDMTIAVDKIAMDHPQAEILSHIFQTNSRGVITNHVSGVRGKDGQLLQKKVIFKATSDSNTTERGRESAPVIADSRGLHTINVAASCYAGSRGCLYSQGNNKDYLLTCEIKGGGCKKGFSVEVKTKKTNGLPRVKRSKMCKDGNKTVAHLRDGEIKLACKTDRDELIELFPNKHELRLSKEHLHSRYLCVTTDAGVGNINDFDDAQLVIKTGKCVATQNRMQFSMQLNFSWE